MPKNQSSKFKKSECQQFSRNDLDTWQERLDHVHKFKQDLLELLQAPSQQAQLAALKKVSVGLRQPTPVNITEPVLWTLVEIHSQCSPRHPLQRAIASLLQSLSDDSVQLVVKERIGKTLERILEKCGPESQCVDKQLKALHYMEVLLENFGLGLETVESHLPLVLSFIVSMMLCYKDCQQDKSSAMVVLLTLIKTATSLLLKTSLQVYLMLTERVEGVNWPDDCLHREKWVKEKMAALVKSSEEILMKSEGVPHDVTVSAAMLLVASLNITLGLLPSFGQEHSPSTAILVDKIQDYCSSLSSFSRLSLCHALLAKLSTAVVMSVEMDGRPLLVTLFEYLTHLSNSFSESSKRYVASRTLALWTNVARECVGSVGSQAPLSLALVPSGFIMKKLLHYIWSQWEDPIDGIRHQCREMFENIVKTYKLLQHFDEYLSELAEMLLSTDAPRRGRYILLSTLSPHVPVERILELSPQLPQQLMSVMGHQALACHAGDLWSRLVVLHWLNVVGNVDIETEWSKVWLQSLLSVMCGEDQLALKHITQHCLPFLFQNCSKSLQLIMTQFQAMPVNVTPSKVLTAQLACFRSAKAHLKEGLSELTHLYSLEDLFKRSMGHADEQVRLSALGLLCESQRTTDPPDPALLPYLISFLELNGNSQSPGFRTPVLSSFKKLFTRMRDSCYSLSKAFQKSRGLSENPEKLVAKYQGFLRLLLEQQFDVLHPLSSYQRRSLSLSLLQTIAAIFSPVQDTSISPVFVFPVVVSEVQAHTLVEGLKDPFDANRIICLELLYRVDPTKIGLSDPDYLAQCVKSYVRLVCSPKSVDCSSASFLLKLLTHFCCSEFNTSLSYQLLFNATLSEGDDPLVTTLSLLCQLLQSHMTLARPDIVQASISSPMYGVLQSIRTLLETLKPATAAHPTVRGVVDLAIQVSDIVSPVVCDSSPEGFLPSQDKNTSSLSSQTQSTTGNAQSLLLCCWHSMKEISLLLGYLVGELPVISDANEAGVLTQNQVERISEVFIHQLTEARHRGAFEMAYTGFCKLCNCLWSSHSPSLSKKPTLWIQDLLDSLQTSSLTRLLSITRRSAGLPFYVQAILISEPGYTSYSCLKYTLNTLLQVARSGLSSSVTTPTDPPPQSSSAAVHALNILRSLYRESKLGDLVMPFIPEGVMIAIDGFSASLWPVRNSSTLLFSALVSRVFGAKRVQDEHSIENKMTAREFFSRFSPLYDYLLEQLQISAAELSGSIVKLLQPSLFPSLLLLSRLYPSPLDDEHTPYTLHPFIPFLLNCVRCPVWKTRVLVSRTIASFTTSSNLAGILIELYDRMSLCDQNCLHGSLLTVSLLLTERRELLCSSEESSVLSWLLEAHLRNNHIASRDNTCGLTVQLYLEILHALLELSTTILHSLSQPGLDVLKTLLSTAYEQCFSTSPCNTLFVNHLTEANYRLLLLTGNNHSTFHRLIPDSPVPEVEELLRKAITTHNPILSLHSLKALRRFTTKSEEEDQDIVSCVCELIQLESNSDILTEGYKFLAENKLSQDVVTKLFPVAYQLCLKPTNTLELRLALIHFISKSLSILPTLDKTILAEWVSYLGQISVPTQPFEIRQCVARQLANLWALSVTDCSSLLILCDLTITLLQDSDLDVRVQAALYITQIVPVDVRDNVTDVLPSQALRMFISHTVPNTTFAFDALTSLLPSLTQETTLLSTLNHSHHTSVKSTPSRTDVKPTMDTPSTPNNLLFDEDPINDYAEDILVTELVVRALMDKADCINTSQLSRLASMLPKLVDERGNDKTSSSWDDKSLFRSKMKHKVLEPLFRLVTDRNCLLTDSLDQLHV